MAVEVNCRCGRSFAVGDDHAGRRAMCPTCGATVSIPGRPAGDAGDRGADERGGRQPEPEPDSALELAPVCGICGAEMAGGDVVCTSCGFDRRSGGRIGRGAVDRAMFWSPQEEAHATEALAQLVSVSRKLRIFALLVAVLTLVFLSGGTPGGDVDAEGGAPGPGRSHALRASVPRVLSSSGVTVASAMLALVVLMTIASEPRLLPLLCYAGLLWSLLALAAAVMVLLDAPFKDMPAAAYYRTGGLVAFLVLGPVGMGLAAAAVLREYSHVSPVIAQARRVAANKKAYMKATRRRACPRCGAQVDTVSYFSAFPHVARLIRLSPLVMPAVRFWRAKRHKRLCPRCRRPI